MTAQPYAPGTADYRHIALEFGRAVERLQARLAAQAAASASAPLPALEPVPVIEEPPFVEPAVVVDDPLFSRAPRTGAQDIPTRGGRPRPARRR